MMPDKPTKTHFRIRPIRRSIAIPLCIAAAIILFLIFKELLPHVPYWMAGNPAAHASITPENAIAHVQVDLSRIRSIPMPADTIQRLEELVGIGPDQQPDTWAGRFASYTILPNNDYLIIVDVRDHNSAKQALTSFLSDPRHHVRELWPDRLVIASSSRIAAEVRDRAVNPNLTTLAETEYFRHAILNRPESSKPPVLFYIRPHALPKSQHEYITPALRLRRQLVPLRRHRTQQRRSDPVHRHLSPHPRGRHR